VLVAAFAASATELPPDKKIDPMAYQFRCHLRQEFTLAIGPVKPNRDVFTLDESGWAKPLVKAV
jgi:hypothetical protein